MTRLLGAGIIVLLAFTPSHGQENRPHFEVAVVKSCGAADPGFRGGGPTEFSPNRVAINCQILKGLIQQAYLAHPEGRTDPSAVLRTPIEGGPDWISAERYSITAKTTEEASQGMMMGPYLQTLLEERFQLKIRRLTREIPTWDLVVAKGGPKLTPFVEGSCVQLAPGPPTLPLPPPPPGQHYCGNRNLFTGGNLVLNATGSTLAEVARLQFFMASGRPVTDKTGLTGKYNFHLEYAPDQNSRLPQINGQDAPEATAPSFFTAIQEQLGLKLEPSKGPGEYLVIDHVERPADN